MRSRAIFFGVILPLTTVICSAQSNKPSQLLARVSYNSESSRICFAVYKNGEFFRSSRDGLTLLDPNALDGPRILQGKLSEEQLHQLKTLLEEIDFRPQARSGLVLNGADWFAAEIVQDHKTRHYKWVNADDQDPFPHSISELVGWLQNFKAQDARLVASRGGLSSLRICPQMNIRQVQPVIAGLKGESDALSCGGGKP
jgi:hypothetical protein